MLLERSQEARFKGIYFVKFGLRMWEILNFRLFLSLKIQIHNENTGFWKEKLVKSGFTLGPMAQATKVSMKEDSLFFFLFFCYIEISQEMVALDSLLVPMESP